MSAQKQPLITFTDFIGGYVSGITHIVVGQPFDMVKVRMQTGSKDAAMTIVKNIYSKDGVKGFYKGTLTPLVGHGLCMALQFLGFQLGKRLISNFRYNGNEKKLNIKDFIAAGWFSGFFHTWVQSPMELTRIKMQIVDDSGKTLYKSSIDAGIQIYKEQGLRGLYFGYAANTLRETTSATAYFGIYMGLMNNAMARHNNDRKAIPLWEIMLYGSLSGYCLWTLVYPIDLIKSKMQGTDFKTTPYRSIIFTGKELYKEKGLKGMFTGIVPCQLRGIAVASTGFLALEFVVDAMKNKGFK